VNVFEYSHGSSTNNGNTRPRPRHELIRTGRVLDGTIDKSVDTNEQVRDGYSQNLREPADVQRRKVPITLSTDPMNVLWRPHLRPISHCDQSRASRSSQTPYFRVCDCHDRRTRNDGP
jgi:hypothetical protein